MENCAVLDTGTVPSRTITCDSCQGPFVVLIWLRYPAQEVFAPTQPKVSLRTGVLPCCLRSCFPRQRNRFN